MPRPLLPESRIAPAVLARLGRKHHAALDAVLAAVDTHDVVVVGMGWNPHVPQARAALDAAGIAYTYLGFGNYLTGWKERLAIKIWSGFPTFPQVFVKGVLFGGNTDVRAAIADGTLRARLAEPR